MKSHFLRHGWGSWSTHSLNLSDDHRPDHAWFASGDGHDGFESDGSQNDPMKAKRKKKRSKDTARKQKVRGLKGLEKVWWVNDRKTARTKHTNTICDDTKSRWRKLSKHQSMIHKLAPMSSNYNYVSNKKIIPKPTSMVGTRFDNHTSTCMK